MPASPCHSVPAELEWAHAPPTLVPRNASECLGAATGIATERRSTTHLISTGLLRIAFELAHDQCFCEADAPAWSTDFRQPPRSIVVLPRLVAFEPLL